MFSHHTHTLTVFGLCRSIRTTFWFVQKWLYSTIGAHFVCLHLNVCYMCRESYIPQSTSSIRCERIIPFNIHIYSGRIFSYFPFIYLVFLCARLSCSTPENTVNNVKVCSSYFLFRFDDCVPARIMTVLRAKLRTEINFCIFLLRDDRSTDVHIYTDTHTHKHFAVQTSQTFRQTQRS